MCPITILYFYTSNNISKHEFSQSSFNVPCFKSQSLSESKVVLELTDERGFATTVINLKSFNFALKPLSYRILLSCCLCCCFSFRFGSQTESRGFKPRLAYLSFSEFMRQISFQFYHELSVEGKH